MSIPVIACGGAGNIEHVVEVIEKGKADAVSLASVFHYQPSRRPRREGRASTEGNTEFCGAAWALAR